jgi:hypothetical protein
MDQNIQKMRPGPAAPRRYDGQAGNPLYDPQQGGHYGKSRYLRVPMRAERVMRSRGLAVSRSLLNPR